MTPNYEVFGKYLLLEKLATGGMAEVYLARSTGAIGITKFVAIKRILPQFSDSPDFIEMFKDEAKIAIHLSHSNIVSIFEFGVEKNQFYLAMDYVEGKNLRQILNKMKKSKAQLGIDQMVYIAKEVAAGLDHAHRCLDGTTGRPLNITHRDMSPQNIMVSFEGEVKLVDFGIAKAESQIETTKAGTLKGKFGYMSPEQADGLNVDFRTDIFSLGIVLWELLANERLFMANNELNTLRKIRDCHVPSLRKINPSIPTDLEKIVSRALSKDRNMRYQSASEMHKDLNRFLNRQYPDFSAQDFSVFCKTLFADEIMETRKRLIEYSKISSVSMDATLAGNYEVTETLTDHSDVPLQLRSTNSGTLKETRVQIAPEKIKKPKAPMSAPAAKPVKPVKRIELSASPLNPPRGSGVFGQKALHSNTDPFARHPGTTSNAEDARTAMQQRSSGPLILRIFTNSFVLAAILVVAAAGKFMSWKNPKSLQDVSSEFADFFNGRHRPRQIAQLQSQAPSKQPTPTASGGPAANATAPGLPTTGGEKYTVLVTSSPAAAEIALNGVSTGTLTPGTINVDAGKPFSITLRADGYLNYQKTLVANQNPLKVQATLQKARLGYLSISVMPAGATIYINDQALSEKPPLVRYAVPADTVLSIRATNRFTGATDETKVSVEQNKVKKVNLYPKTQGRSR